MRSVLVSRSSIMYRICTTRRPRQRPISIQSRKSVALCIAWRFVLLGALCYVALCVAWRFVPRGASWVALSGPPYVALSGQKAPHRARHRRLRSFFFSWHRCCGALAGLCDTMYLGTALPRYASCIQAHLQTKVRYAHSNYVSEYRVSRGL